MYLIEQVTDDSLQEQTLTLADGTSLKMTLYYVPMQYGWFITELTYGDLTIRGLRITNSPNILHQFKNQLPFGLACVSKDDREPTQQEDFSSGASKLYILSESEVEGYTDFLSGEV